MKRVGAVAIAAVCIIATIAAATSIADLSSNYFSGRSGPIMVIGQNPTVRDSHAVLIDSSRYLTSGVALASMPLNSLVRLLTESMAITELIGEQAPETEKIAHNKGENKPAPKAQIIFNVESVGKTTLDRFHLTSLSNPSSPHLSISLNSPSITPPAASISVATSVATGAPVSTHGIVGAEWKSATGVVSKAYSRSSPKDSFAAVANLADAIATHTNGRGLTISASGSESLAWAFGVNKALADTRRIDGWTNNYCFALTHSATSFQSVSENTAPALNFQIGQLQKQMESSPTSVLNNLGTNMHAKVENHIVTLTYSSSKISNAVETVKFDLTQKADVLFLAELQYALDFPSKLKQVASLHAALQDEDQDLIVFSFSGFTALLEQYGRESEQFRGALKMFDQLFPLLSSEYANLFSAPTIQSLVLLGSHASVLEKTDPRQVQAVLKADHVNTDYYPNVYVGSSDVASVCAKLNKDLSALKYIAYCPSAANHHTHMLVESYSSSEAAAAAGPTGRATRNRASTSATDYYYPTNDEIQRYQIVLWLSIFFVLIAIGAVYQLAFMSFKKDTMLYSSFNPNWEDRKRR